MAGKKLSAKERLAKLQAKQGERGQEFAGGKKLPTPEPPQKASEEKPSVFERPPVQPVVEEPERDATQGLDLNDSAVMDLQDDIPEVPSSRGAPSTRVDSSPPVVAEPEEAEKPFEMPSVAEETESVSEPPSLEELVPPADLGLVGDSGREDETKPEVKRPSKPPARTLLSADLEDPVADELASAMESAAEASEAVEEPEGTKYHVRASAIGDPTPLVSGIVVNYVTASASSKMFMVKGSSEAQTHQLAPGDEKSFEIETPDGLVKITMQNKEGEVTAYVVGGKTQAGALAAKAGKLGLFLANVRYYLPELTMATLFTAATTAVLWTQQFVSDTLQNFHKPAVIAYGVFQLALTTWAVIEQKKNRKAAEAQEALKQ